MIELVEWGIAHGFYEPLRDLADAVNVTIHTIGVDISTAVEAILDEVSVDEPSLDEIEGGEP
jgi:hypothetical protein